MRALLALLLLISTQALAETGWLTARGQLQPELRVEAWGGSNSFGAGFVLPDEKGARAAWSGELAYAFRDRTVALRGGRAWQVSPTQYATGSVTLALAGHLVPEGRFDFGVGPHLGLNLSLGREVFTVDLGLSTGAELFWNPWLPRLPQRAQLGLNLRLGDWALGLHARVGADVIPGQPFVGRGELALTLGWFGLERLRTAPTPPTP